MKNVLVGSLNIEVSYLQSPGLHIDQLQEKVCPVEPAEKFVVLVNCIGTPILGETGTHVKLGKGESCFGVVIDAGVET